MRRFEDVTIIDRTDLFTNLVDAAVIVVVIYGFRHVELTHRVPWDIVTAARERVHCKVGLSQQNMSFFVASLPAAAAAAQWLAVVNYFVVNYVV